MRVSPVCKNILNKILHRKYFSHGGPLLYGEAGTDLQVLLGLPQLVGRGGGPGETGRLPAGDGEDDHHQDQQQAQH